MPTVEAFGPVMIEKFLKGAGLRFLKDEDGDYVVQFSHDDDWGCSLTVNLMLVGKQKEVLALQVVPDKKVSRADWGRALLTCNEWNKKKSWPKGYLFAQNPDTDEKGRILASQSLDLEKGIHQEFFDFFTRGFISSAFEFYKWLHQEQGF
jgi:hypothetical protein